MLTPKQVISIAENGNVTKERREHYLKGWLSYQDRTYVTEWHMAHLIQEIPIGKYFDGLWELRDYWLPRILDDLEYKGQPIDKYKQRLRERVKALLLDAASRLDNTYSHKPLRKTIKKSDFAPENFDWKKGWWGMSCEDWIKLVFFRWSCSSVFCAGEHVADILIAATWNKFSPEAEKFVAYQLATMAETIDL